MSMMRIIEIPFLEKTPEQQVHLVQLVRDDRLVYKVPKHKKAQTKTAQKQRKKKKDAFDILDKMSSDELQKILDKMERMQKK